MRTSLKVFLLTLAAVPGWATTASPPSCSVTQLCPKEYPCCIGGTCGTGTYCLGGCEPLLSYSLDACTPKPVGHNQTYTWPDLNRTIANGKYLGNASAADWELSGTPKLSDGHVILTMPKDTGGSLLSSTQYIWYGKVAADIKSSRGAGVVTAFILMSDVKDEIDFEWVGSNLREVQTNFYFQGVTNYTNGAKAPLQGGNSYETWHHYEIDWTPSAIHWSVDGTVIRTLLKSSTWNATANRYQYPQTPSRLQLSLWPGGRAGAAQGTIDWAGGNIEWDSTDIREQGFYAAEFANITVQSYAPPEDSGSGSRSYVYVDRAGLEGSVRITDNGTVLADLGRTGLDTGIDEGSASGGHGGKGGSASGTAAAVQGTGTGTGFAQKVASNLAAPGTEGSWRGLGLVVLLGVLVLG
ncbi:uncharacterized protein BO72DRAFT_423599 [Aspergillus fijiensis CBS 313.89]|uniref:GH16 domain-containing protein n=1 Tax=Aspergillus fijiensis CBS 313.89 TaxID=1448319 RepID=A0A8G1W216_9EURO|nr:uncharacterized protein BO72DRAFT_423599 [Aspergillus fijiensis CBS 313.89]RAK80238.1 hypothetical protein BO72DRAFT_423599 [Aspergillus fijiensis CBS 313.89]